MSAQLGSMATAFSKQVFDFSTSYWPANIPAFFTRAFTYIWEGGGGERRERGREGEEGGREGGEGGGREGGKGRRAGGREGRGGGREGGGRFAVKARYLIFNNQSGNILL